MLNISFIIDVKVFKNGVIVFSYIFYNGFKCIFVYIFSNFIFDD